MFALELGNFGTVSTLVKLHICAYKLMRDYSIEMTQLFWVSILMLPFNIVGNLLVLLIYRRTKMSKNSFLLFVNLALADLCFGIGEVVFVILNKIMVNNNDRASLLCQLNVFLTYQTCSVSVFTLMVMSIERYVVIITPFKLMSIKTPLLYKAIVVLTWLISAILTAPFVPFVTAQAKRNDTLSNSCTLGTLYFSTIKTYHMFLGIIIVLIPYVLMCVMYTKTVRFLWDSSVMNKKATRNQTLTKSRKRLTVLMAIITLLFTLCWIHMPIRRGIDLILQKREYILLDSISIQVLAFHAVLNPILYFITSSSFRESVKSIFSCRRKVRVGLMVN